MPHEQSFRTLFYRHGIQTHRHAALILSRLPLLRASGKDKTMRIPKTPIEFDYDLWTTEDSKCMVRVKATGEVTEVDREVMKSLRAEEKKLRRSYGAVGTSDDEDNAKKSSDTVLSLDALPEEDVKSSAWLADPANNIEMALTEMCIEDFRRSLSSIQLEIFDVVMIGGVGVREYARQKGINHKTVVEAIASMRKKLRKIF